MKKKKILIIDDDEIVRASCMKVLSSENFDVYTESDSASGIEAVFNNDFDLCLIDLKMPVLDGLQITERIREKLITMPIILMSGYSTSEIIAKSIKIGADSFINKPFTPEELIGSVVQAITKEGKDEENKSFGN